jgi:hypothetical protein
MCEGKAMMRKMQARSRIAPTFVSVQPLAEAQLIRR